MHFIKDLPYKTVSNIIMTVGNEKCITGLKGRQYPHTSVQPAHKTDLKTIT